MRLGRLAIVSLAAVLAVGAPCPASPDAAADKAEIAGTAETKVRFAAPKRMKAGASWLGEGRLYPSPAAHDLNGDGQLDVVIGDLPGRVTAALRGQDGSLAAEAPVDKRDGKPLKFHNW